MNLVKLQQHAYRSVFFTHLLLSHVWMLYLHVASVFLLKTLILTINVTSFWFCFKYRHICFQSHVDWDSFNTLVWMLGYIVCLRIVNVAELYFVHHFNIIQSLYTNLVNNLDLYIIVNKGSFLVCTIDNNRIINCDIKVIDLFCKQYAHQGTGNFPIQLPIYCL